MHCKGYLRVLSLLVVLLYSCGFSQAEGIGVGDRFWGNDYGTLILSNIIYRHGDRTPVRSYPLDPYKDPSNWPEGWGQLTKNGKEQHYRLGLWIRQRYGMLLSNSYSMEDIYVRSTDVDRTLMSAESNLAGLYMPVPAQEWNPNIKWQPIPVHTVPEQMDEVLAAKKPCPRYDEALKEVLKSEPMQQINQKYARLYQYISIHSGEKVTDVTGVNYVYNTLYIEDLYNFTLPSWTNTVYPDQMAVPAALSFTVQAFTKEMARLKSGPLLGEIAHNIQQKMDRKLYPNRKMFMYSAHDTTVANLLMLLQVFEVQSPPYCSTIFIDLWQNEDKFYVTVMYKNSTGEPHVLQIPGCDQACPMNQFLSIAKSLIPSNWEKECIAKNPDDEESENYSACIGIIVWFLIGAFMILSCACFLSAGVHFWFRDFRHKQNVALYERVPVTDAENVCERI